MAASAALGHFTAKPREDAFELKCYLERIGLSEERLRSEHAAASLELLAVVTFGHATHIPFENLACLYPEMRVVGLEGLEGREREARQRIKVSLEPSDIYEKLVVRRRGGFCFEQNLLLARALRGLGFSVATVGARGGNRVGTGPDWGFPLGPTTHLALVV